jgi:hypothetical protein
MLNSLTCANERNGCRLLIAREVIQLARFETYRN